MNFSPELIPMVDSAGLPGPIWLFQFLLVFTFVLHLLFMNLTLGGTLLAAIAHSLSKGRQDDPRAVIAKRMTGINGYAISMTITTGVAPLLFIQVIFHQFFYTGTLLIGSLWLSMLLFLTIGYYAVYLYKFKGAPAGRSGGGLWLWSAAVFFLLVGVVQVAVHLVSVRTDRWAEVYANPGAIFSDPTFAPRFLHFLLAGIGMAALVVAWWAVRQAGKGVDREINTQIAGFTWKWALWSTALQLVDGFLLLFLLPEPVVLGLMRGGAVTMLPFTIGLLAAFGLLLMLFRVSDPTEKPSLVTGVLATSVITIAVMSITRDQIRSLYLDQAVDLSHFSVVAQWGNVVLFSVLLVAGLGTIYAMVRRVLAEPATGEDAA